MNVDVETARTEQIRQELADCSDLLDQLESALDSAEKVCPEEELQEYTARLAGARKK